ncbi:MAG: PqqD family protein [Clostridiaceae bacterium]|nr:PqqD family protein [Clostridiaceae bacterium]
MAKKITKNANFLKLVPYKNMDQKWELKDDGLVRIIVMRDGLLDRAVRMFFKTPKEMKIDLDDQGSCVWKCIDNHRNIEEIGKLLIKEFGDKAEPLYQRLGTYINILRNNKFIKLKEVSD